MNNTSALVQSAPIPHLIPGVLEAGAPSFTWQRINRALDPLSLKCMIFSHTLNKPLLDFGCGEGLATTAALGRGVHVQAIDPDQAAIQGLLARTPQEQHQRLQARVANLQDLDFKGAGFGAVHAARTLNLLEGAAIERTLRKFFRWLYPDGKLFLSALTPDGAFWTSFRREFMQRAALGVRWPGYLEDMSPFATENMDTAAPHLLDEHTLRRELAAAGFLIEKASTYALPWDETQTCCGLIARCGP